MQPSLLSHLKQGHVLQISARSISPDHGTAGHPKETEYELLTERPDLSWFEVMKGSRYYYVNSGRSDGSFSKCRGCHRRLVKSPFRIETRALPSVETDQEVRHGFHVDLKCIRRALNRDQKDKVTDQGSHSLFLPRILIGV